MQSPRAHPCTEQGTVSEIINDSVETHVLSRWRNLSSVPSLMMTQEQARLQLTQVPLLAVMSTAENMSLALFSNLPEGCFGNSAEVQYRGKRCFLVLVGVDLDGVEQPHSGHVHEGGPGIDEDAHSFATSAVPREPRSSAGHDNSDAIAQLLKLERQVREALKRANRNVALNNNVDAWIAMLQLPLLLAVPSAGAIDHSRKAFW